MCTAHLASVLDIRIYMRTSIFLLSRIQEKGVRYGRLSTTPADIRDRELVTATSSASGEGTTIVSRVVGTVGFRREAKIRTLWTEIAASFRTAVPSCGDKPLKF